VIDDSLLKAARIRAAHEDTSVNAMVRQFIEDYARSSHRQAAAKERIMEIAAGSPASSGQDGRQWTRDSLYER
jgi:plasmid stability protein